MLIPAAEIAAIGIPPCLRGSPSQSCIPALVQAGDHGAMLMVGYIWAIGAAAALLEVVWGTHLTRWEGGDPCQWGSASGDNGLVLCVVAAMK